MPRLDELKTFCKVIEFKSFSHAAEQMGITQPAVSQQIKSLENEFDVQLLHREGVEILPTEAGRMVYETACQMLRLYEDSQQQIQYMGRKLAGRLQIGASSGPGERLVPLLLGRFKLEHPDLQVALRVGDSREIIDAIFTRQLELGFVGSFRRDRHLTFETYLEDQLVLVVYPTHPWAGRSSISYHELQAAPLILQQQGSGATTVLQDALREQGISLRSLNVVMELGLQESARAAVLAGYGVTLISRLGVKRELERRELVEVPVEDLELKRSIYICYNRSVPLSNLAQVFLEFTKTKGNLA